MLVSVVIPTYNRARTIARAVDSVLAQTWKPLEIIIVDSCSTDRTADVLTRYCGRIRLVRQERRGPSAARNAGIKEARGEIMSFLDSDDEWLPDKIERQVRLLEAAELSGVRCCVSNAKLLDPKAAATTSFALADMRPELREGVWTNPTEILIDRFLLFNQVVAVRREAIEDVGGFREGSNVYENLMEDYDLAVRLSLLGPWAFIADPLVVWHGGTEGSLSQGASELDKCRRAFEILSDLDSSPQLGSLLPRAVLHRRLRFLKLQVGACRLSGHPNRLSGLFGKFLLVYLRGMAALQRRLPSCPRMATRPV